MRFKHRFQTWSRQDKTILAALLAVTIGGAVAVAIGLLIRSPQPPQPPVNAGQTSSMSEVSGQATKDEIDGPVMSYAEPVSLRIPAMNVQSNLIYVGKNPNGTVEVPLGENTNKPAWYKHSPTPGQVGPAIIMGHLTDAGNNPSIFFNLGTLRPGDKVYIPRVDGKTAIFTITKVESYDKSNFPTEKVYGFTDHAALRLITCGGAFNPQLDRYSKNIIAFGKLTGSRPTA